MKKFKHAVSILLILALFISAMPAAAFADSSTFLEVVKEGAPIRAKAAEEGRVVERCAVGAVLECTGSKINHHMNRWYIVKTSSGGEAYIYSGNVKEHSHNYTDLRFEDITYSVCNCGRVQVKADNEAKEEEGSKVLAAVSAALPAAVADGPLPVGDLVGIGIVIVSVAALHDVVLSTDSLSSAISLADFDEYLSKKEGVCNSSSFRKVARLNGNLKYIDNRCLDLAEAYIYVLLGGDVYTPDENNAMMLAAEYGRATFERDKDKISYFYHYHFGLHFDEHGNRIENDTVGGHIFFGLNDLGQGPI